MTKAIAGIVEIEYEVIGASGPPVIVLIQGLGSQLVSWDIEFCEELGGESLAVVRFDNRDAGKSSDCSNLGPYTFSDMANDVIAVIDDLHAEKAHLFGVSMGGMIGQNVALEHPTRVTSLTCLTTATGDGTIDNVGMQPLSRQLAQDFADDSVEAFLRTAQWLAGPLAHINESRIRARALAMQARGEHPSGVKRQTAAMVASRPILDQLSMIRVPTLFIHGGADPVLSIGASRVMHQAVADSSLEVIGGLGHLLTENHWPEVVTVVRRHVDNAEARNSS